MISLDDQISKEHIDIQANSKLLKTKKHWQHKEDSTGYKREIVITTPKRIWRRKRKKEKKITNENNQNTGLHTRYRKQSSILFCKNNAELYIAKLCESLKLIKCNKKKYHSIITQSYWYFIFLLPNLSPPHLVILNS